ncbi:hypothetical protein FGM00_05635 [Aggregatimonas sangjinii]|uniref:Metal-dependent hydrolase n=1 Tax=Aggregatimonas sangjinii TaxID=2583587 RepID=A0A5B7SQD3_9FLAO|nr:DUF6122 family protein [Aggregatimonas sangjinii]QCW99608.1 hypothetical protein FGM00_05635 [Aggregatimonas sangjinii]
MFRELIHYGIHFIVPVLIGVLFFKQNRVKVILILWAGILIDIDHLWANPIFDSNRCSIDYHPLHSYWAIAVYLSLLSLRKTRVLGIALVLHIIADVTDCYLLFLQSK